MTFRKILNMLNVILVAIIALGVVFIVSYISFEANRKTVDYISLKLNKDEYQTSSAFTYTITSCRYVGPEVAGSISRQFIPVEQINGSWQPVKGRAPILLFDSTNVTNDKGCRVANTTTIIPIMPSGYYQLKITGDYNVLSFLPSSVQTVSSQTVHVTESQSDIENAGDLSSEINETIKNNQSTSTTTQQSTTDSSSITSAQPSSTVTTPSSNQDQSGTSNNILTPITGLVTNLVDGTQVSTQLKL